MKEVLKFFLTWFGFWVFTVLIAYLGQGCEMPFSKCFTLEVTWKVAIFFGWLPAIAAVAPRKKPDKAFVCDLCNKTYKINLRRRLGDKDKEDQITDSL